MKLTRISTAVGQGSFDWGLVKVETDTGVTGLGEADWDVGVADLVHKAAPVLIGENPFNIGKLYDVMSRCRTWTPSSGHWHPLAPLAGDRALQRSPGLAPGVTYCWKQ